MTIPARGRLLGIDMGNVRIGLAVCDVDHRMASPLGQYQRQAREQDRAYFANLVTKEQIAGLIVGLPIHMNGSEGTQAKAYREYGDWLAGSLALPVAYADERLTTFAAEDLLWDAGLTHAKRKARRDQLAATFILQHFLEMERSAGMAPVEERPT